jgi:hypothetical protein
LRFRNLAAGLLAAAGAFACGRESEAPRPISVSIVPAATNRPAHVVVEGVDRRSLRSLRSAPTSGAPWDSLFRVSVAADAPPVAGKFTATDSTLEFDPSFPFDEGREYFVRFDPRRLPATRPESTITTILLLPKANLVPTTNVARILPSGDLMPENQLRVYIEFTAPMSRQSGLAFARLINDSGREVMNAFLPLDADFWNPSHTRFTLFLDPGRVKQGIRPNEELGRPLKAGRAYAIVIDSAWRDANGLPLAKPYRHEFRAGPAITEGIDLAKWKITAPRGSTFDTLVVTFPVALDHGLLQRAVGVERANGELVQGTVTIGPRELTWRFVPTNRWVRDDYRIVALSILEDGAGNRIGRPFEVDMFERADSTSVPERHTLPFKIR